MPILKIRPQSSIPPRPPNFNVELDAQGTLTKVGVFYASANASAKTSINIEIGGMGGAVIYDVMKMGVFYANTGIGELKEK